MTTRCSHGIPFENKCYQCVEAAMAKVTIASAKPQEPPTDLAKRAEWWAECYRKTVVPNTY